MKKALLALLSILVWGTIISAPTDGDITLLRKRFKDSALSPNVNSGSVKRVLDSFIAEDSIWPGINYSDVSAIAFEHTKHLSNMAQLAVAFSKPDSPYYQSAEVKAVLDKSLDFWIAHDFQCENWWNNQIDTPNQLMTILYAVDDKLSSRQIEGILRISGRANMTASGARPSGDRVKIANTVIKTAVYHNDAKKVGEIMAMLDSEFDYIRDPDIRRRIAPGVINPLSGGRGLESDYSFHHREDRVNNTLTYGTGFANTYIDLGEKMLGTKYALSDRAIRLLTDYYLDGIIAQMAFGIIEDPGVQNRDISRPREANKQGVGDLTSLSKLSDYRRADIEKIIKARKGGVVPRSSFAKNFWMADHFVFQRPNYYTSVRMFSTRCSNMEAPYNGEGLTNHYRGDGTNYLTITGKEYSLIAPYNDWRKIPGATVMQGAPMPAPSKIQHIGLTDFVGGVSDGLYGAAAFDFVSPLDSVRAKKSWFFFDNNYVCLGADISLARDNEVATTLNQTFLQGDIYIKATNQQPMPLKQGNNLFKSTEWVHHNNVGYAFATPTDLNIFNGPSSGSWYTVNHQSTISKDTLTKNIFRSWISHGKKPLNQGYVYIVYPAQDLQKFQSSLAQSTTKVISNTSALQAVADNSCGVGYAVCYAPAEFEPFDGVRVGTLSPAILMVRKVGGKTNISVADPTHKLSEIVVTINKKLTILGVKTVWDASKGVTQATIELPQGVFAGSTTTISY